MTIEGPKLIVINTWFLCLIHLVQNILLFSVFHVFDCHFGPSSWILWSIQSKNTINTIQPDLCSQGYQEKTLYSSLWLILFKIFYFSCFSIWHQRPLLGSHLGFTGQDGLRKYQKSFCYIFNARDNSKWHFIWLFVPSVSRDATFFGFQYDCDGHFWTAILNLKVKADPKYNQYHSIRSVKPKLVENNTY